MNDKDILANAEKAKGATHYDEVYLKQRANKTTWMYWDNIYGWQMLKLSGINHYKNLRSLADIKRIAELEKDKVKLKKIVDNHSGGFVACMTGSQFTANNLKQQAKALNEYAYSNKPLTKRGLNLESIALSDQAKTLKEQGK